ncbi:hypothetical protein WA026_005947 [Henosepilachna vigintioctopunctata]|uniref:Uncharacterized protein n=1 Tax=Henosepilachna vigintioctopunctata TaxID=420089 RepID=A0AAW1TUB4_9CUCU
MGASYLNYADRVRARRTGARLSGPSVSPRELQHEVGALLEFRDLVIETFPSLRTKLSSPAAQSALAAGPALARSEWAPGVRVRRKLGASKKSDAVPDSGFSTETSSKDTHSASSTAMATTSAGTADDTDDELWSLLDVIHRKGTRLKDEVETLQGQLQQQSPPDEDFHRDLFRASADDVRQIRRERDSLMERLAEMEAEVVASRIHTSRLQEDLEHLLSTKHDLEEQLRAVLSERGEVNSRIHDLHLQFVAKNNAAATDKARSAAKNERTVSEVVEDDSARVPDLREVRTSGGEGLAESGETLDEVLGGEIPKVQVTDTRKFSVILSESDPLVLQKHLLSSTIHNEILLKQLEGASRLELNLVDKLDKVREENEELKFQLEDKSIELEGTRARVRLLEQIQRTSTPNHHGGPDVIPTSTIGSSPPSRSEILTNSMKNMSPITMGLQVDHSSSTESAHDQMENSRKSQESARRRPSKIPLKSYTAPKPPGRGKSQHQSAHSARSRSGGSPHRPHSAQSARGAGGAADAGSLRVASLPKSRGASLVTAKDSLTSKLRGSDSLPKLSPGNSLGRATLRKGGPPSAVAKWSNREQQQQQQHQATTQLDKDTSSNQASREKYPYRWSQCSFERRPVDSDFPDSLDQSQRSVTDDSSASRKFQTAETFTWNKKEYYDSIDSDLFSSLYQQNGEDLAECDSLERHVSGVSDK